jgi:acetyl-CoA C-acetyltransferase
MTAGSEEERMSGVTFPGLYALMARAYMQKYQVGEDLLASVSVKNHYHGSLNPKAQFQKPITVEQVLKSGKIADPLKLLDCSPISDGAAAVIITGDTQVRKRHKSPINIVASEVATDSLSICERESFTSLKSVVDASRKAYRKAGLSPKDIDVAEIHDCFSIAEVIATEDLGFSPVGKGALEIAEGAHTLGEGKVKTVTNSSGGLKACGHPVGATGIKQIAELVEQLRGEAGTRQVPDAKIGLAHNVGGSGTVAVIHILQK